MDPSRFTGEPYYRDFRDKFEELYETSSSFVRLHDGLPKEGKHIVIESDLSNEASANIYKIICYGYEDSYDCSLIPLYCDPSKTNDRISWRFGDKAMEETSLEDGRRRFDELTELLMKKANNSW